MKFFFRQEKHSRFSQLVICLTLLLFSSIKVNAQGSWNLAMPIDGAGTVGPETGRGICTDALGNVYTVGVFTSSGGSTDFDLSGSSSAASLATSAGSDGYVAKYDKTGAFQWKVVITGAGNDFGSPSDAICTNGTFVWFTGNVNMGGGTAQVIGPLSTVTVTTGGTGNDGLVCKLSCSTGAIQWATVYGSTGAENSQGICVDPNGCCYTIGSYPLSFVSGSVTAPATNGGSDLYIAKFSAGGTMIHFAHGGTTGSEMSATGAGICYVPGATPAIVAVGSNNNGATADYGGHGVTCNGGNDGVLLQLDSQLTFTNAFAAISTAGADEVMGVTYDPFSGGVFMIGYATASSVTVPTSPSATTLTLAGTQDIIVIRYSPSSQTLTWAKSGGGAGLETPGGITSDGQGGIIIAGYTQSSPASFGTVTLPNTNGGDDIFTVRYNTSGTPIWGVTAGSTGSDQARGISSYVETTPSYLQSLYLTGNFQFTVSFGAQTPLVADGGATANNDFFLARINDLSYPLSATQSQVNLTCNGVCTGSATVVASGGTAPYTYSWSPSGGSGATASNLCAINYTCTITDAASTSITKTFNITQPPAMSVTASASPSTICSGNSTTLTASGATTYTWMPGSLSGTSVTVSPTTTTTYTVTGTTGSCSNTAQVTVTVNPTPTVSATASPSTICSGSSSTLTGSGATTYTWMPGSLSGTTVSVSPTTTTTYTVTGTTGSCSSTSTRTITVNPTPTVTATASPSTICSGNSSSLTGSGATTYTWMPGSLSGTTVSVSPTTTTTYTVTGTSSGCSSTGNVTVTVNPSPTVTATASPSTICSGSSSSLTGSGATTYSWMPGSLSGTTVSVSPTTTTTYTVTGTSSGCSSTGLVTVTVNPTPTVTATASPSTICSGSSSSLTGSGATTYSWMPGSLSGTTVSVSPTTTTTYTVTGTSSGCSSTGLVTVTVNPSPTVTATASPSTICSGNSSSLTGSGATTYSWMPGSLSGTTVSVSPTTTTTYTVTGTTGSCSSTGLVTVTVNSTPTVTATASPSTICSGNSSSLTGSGATTYAWMPGSLSGTTVSVSPTTTTTYTVTGTTGSCSSTGLVTVTVNPTPTVTATASPSTICSGNSSSLTGSGATTYSWMPGSLSGTTVSVSPTTTTTYTVTGTSSGCSSTGLVTVTVNPTPTVTATASPSTICSGNSSSLTGSGATTYSWMPGSLSGTTVSVSPTTTTTYTVTGTLGSCSSTGLVTVTVNPTPTVTATASPSTICSGNSSSLTGSGATTYSWMPGSLSGTTVSVSPTTTTTYTVTGTSSGCSNTGLVTVTVNPTPTVTATASPAAICSGSSSSLTGNGATTYSWMPGSLSGTTVSVSPTATTTYTVTGTLGSCSSTSTVTVTVNPNPTASSTATTIMCNGGNSTITVSASGGTSPYTGTGNFTVTAGGPYSYLVTDFNGCSSTTTITVTQPNVLVVSAASQTNVSCNGGSNGAASVTVTGGTTAYSYDWTPGNPTGDGTPSVTGLTQGTYTCTVTDAHLCVSSHSFTIIEPTPIASSVVSQTNVSCNGGNNGAATISATGGSPGYTYSWSPAPGAGQGTASVSGLTGQLYSCTITDANGCTHIQTVNITQPNPLVVTSSTQTNVSCNGGSNGDATVVISGGTPSYTYNWSPSGGNAATGTGLSAGLYTVTITDSHTCILTQTFNIIEPTPLAVTPTQTDVLCNGGNDGSATATVTGGTPGYTYTWVPSGGNAATASGLIAGTYTCFITDSHTCTITQSFTITQPPALTATTMQTNVSCNGGNNGDAMVMVSGGTPGYTYNWTPSGGNAAMATGLAAGIYTCTITDSHTCILTQTFNITEPTALTASASQVDVLCNGNTDGSATVTPSGGVGSYTYAWSPSGGTNATESGLGAGIYTCLITDGNGCTLSQAFNITEPSALTSVTTQTDILCNGSNTGDATVTVSGGTPIYSYAWSSGGTADQETGLTAGSYTCVITDANGCSLTETFLLTEPPAIVVTTSQTGISCNGGNNGSATVFASGGSGSFTYVWAPTGGNAATASSLTAGTYTCTIMDGFGCIYTQTFVLTEPNALSVTSTQQNVNCNGGTGAATVTVSGGTMPYTYLWTSGGTNATESGLTAGSYTCSIVDANGCSTTATFTITEPAALVSTDSQVDILCNGGTNGSATVNVSGGVGPYTYNWTTGGNTATESNLPAGSVFCSITDANGCIITETFIIIEPAPFTGTVTATQNPSACGASDGGINITVNGGTPGYTYAWSNSSNVEDQVGIPAGSYSVVITDNNGCTVNLNASLNDPNAPTVTVQFDTVLCVTGGIYTLTEGSPAGGTWSGTAVSGNTFDPATAGIGSYILSYTYVDINGCTGSASDTLMVDACLGVANDNVAGWSIYPNPTSGEVFITPMQNQSGSVVVEVYSTDGKLIQSENKNANAAIQLDLSGKPSGTYFIRIIGKDSVSSYRIIRQ